MPIHRPTPRHRFAIPSEAFWNMVRPHAQPYLRLGFSMATLVQIAGYSLGIFDNARQEAFGYAQQVLGTRRHTTAHTPVQVGIHYLDTMREYIQNELANVYPELLLERGDFERVTYSLVDTIHLIRSHLCEYVAVQFGNVDPTLRLEKFLGPDLDLVMSMEVPTEPTPYAPDFTARTELVQAAFHRAAAIPRSS